MKALALPLKDSDLRTRGGRRRVCALIAREVMRVHEAEEAYLARMPENIALGYRGLYARVAANELLDAAITLYEAFVPF